MVAKHLIIELILRSNLTWWLLHPAHKGVGERSVLLLQWVHALLPSNVIVFGEMLVQMGLKLLISDESQATVRALELDSLIKLTN